MPIIYTSFASSMSSESAWRTRCARVYIFCSEHALFISRSHKPAPVHTHTHDRHSFVIPGALLIACGVCMYFFSDDTPRGNNDELQKVGAMEKKSATGSARAGFCLVITLTHALLRFYNQTHLTPTSTHTLSQPESHTHTFNTQVVTWVLALQYACCFGVELTVNNMMAAYFVNRFGQVCIHPRSNITLLTPRYADTRALRRTL